ncbi:uncharacterized protein LOC129981567 [Argiope bruennichi]|uniref:uncharacterized protein LOC129981567 n=1 Tax=Argiope bruennichi TaxID=94029 RepID=UPI002495609D|nr:uncharacterized protein LOC129981567 [Argiope bruennichi]
MILLHCLTPAITYRHKNCCHSQQKLARCYFHSLAIIFSPTSKTIVLIHQATSQIERQTRIMQAKVCRKSRACSTWHRIFFKNILILKGKMKNEFIFRKFNFKINRYFCAQSQMECKTVDNNSILTFKLIYKLQDIKR